MASRMPEVMQKLTWSSHQRKPAIEVLQKLTGLAGMQLIPAFQQSQ